MKNELLRNDHAPPESLPRASAEQFELPPRDRINPRDQQPGEPAELSQEDTERLREKRARKTAAHDRDGGRASAPKRPAAPDNADPWAKWRK